jgi:hypothetical protein
VSRMKPPAGMTGEPHPTHSLRHDRLKVGEREVIEGYDRTADPREVDRLVKASSCPRGADPQLFAAVWLRTNKPRRMIDVVSSCCARDQYLPVGNVVEVPGVGAVMAAPQRNAPESASVWIGNEARSDAATWPWVINKTETPEASCTRCGHPLDLTHEGILTALVEYRRTGRNVRHPLAQRV